MRLFAEFELDYAGERVAAIASQRQRSLLAYLALHRGKPQSRSHLAFTFWPDSSEKQAQTNLRNVLYSIRQSLPDVDRFLQADGRSIEWRSDAELDLDVEAFERAVGEADEALGREDVEGAKVFVDRALSVYRGDLLPELYENWVQDERERLKLAMADLLEDAASAYESQGDSKESIKLFKKLIQIDPLRETYYCGLIRVYLQEGDAGAALNLYNECVAVLDRELGVGPGEALLALHAKIRERPVLKPTIETSASRVVKAPRREELREKGSAVSGRWTAFAALGMVVVLVAIFNVLNRSPVDRSIAILPFENRSSLPEDSYFTDGIHDDLVSSVSRIRDLKTISRTSVMGYRGSDKNVKAIGKELGAATILEGGVQRSGDHIRINVQLIDAVEDVHLWSETYDRELTAENVFDIQSEIASEIARSLRTVLSADVQANLRRVPTSSLEALEAFFRGKELMFTRESDDLFDAVDYFERAIELDAEFAEAYGYLAHATLDQIFYHGLDKGVQLKLADSLIDRALELDPYLSSAYSALGSVKRYQGEIEEAVAAYERALELNPNDAQSYYQFGVMLEWDLRRQADALVVLEKAVELDPVSFGDRVILNSALASMGRLDESLEILQSAIEANPGKADTYFYLGRLYAGGYNRADEANFWLRKGFALDPKNHNIPLEIAVNYETLDDFASARVWLQRALDLAPNSHNAIFYTGLGHRYRNEREASLEWFRKTPVASDFSSWALYFNTNDDLRNARFQEAFDQFVDKFPGLNQEPPQLDRNNYWAASGFALALKGLGRSEQATTLVEKKLEHIKTMIRFSPGFGGYTIYDAHAYAVLGDTKAALRALEEAFEQGFLRSVPEMLECPELDSLHDEPRFAALLEKIKTRQAEQLENLRRYEASGELAAIPPLPVD